MKIHYTGIWRNGRTYTVVAPNGNVAWKELIRWAVANNIQFPSNFMMTRR